MSRCEEVDEMKRRKFVGACLAFLSISLFLLTACGKEEVYRPEVGVDGYVYTVQKFQISERLQGDIKVVDSYVYYARQMETGEGSLIERLSLEAIEADGEILKQPEKVRDLSSRWKDVPDYIAEKLQSKFLTLEEEGEERPGWAVEADGSLADMSQTRCFFSLLDFDVDTEGNLYCREEVGIGRNYEYEPAGEVLSKWNCKGEEIYHIYHPDMSGFALCEDGGVCILGDGRLIFADREGIPLGELSTERYRGDGQPGMEKLLRDGRGYVYYVLQNSGGIGRVFQASCSNDLQLQEIEGGFYEAVRGKAYASEERKLLIYSPYYDRLYEYDVENGSEREVLNWLDSGFLCQYVQSVARVAQGKLLVYYDDYSSEYGLYLLTGTLVEDLPKRETIVVFSYAPTDVLKKTVLRFNKENDTYWIIIDDYGSEFSWKTREGDAFRVDLAVVSQTPPDILDMTFLDSHKYAGKKVLEDLRPYLEESSILNPQDFLEEVLEGMTIDGCLICIPHEFNVEWLLGRKSQLGVPERWDMEEVYDLSEEYPESAHMLVCDNFGRIKQREYFLNTLCSYYCLEEFIDWEKKECRFDSEEFAWLLEWVWEYAEGSSGREEALNDDISYISEDVLLIHDSMPDFQSMAAMEVRCGDEVVLMGFPSADGKGRYPVFMRDALAIAANSPHKEGAWTFLEYFLSMSETERGFSARKEWLCGEAEKAARQEYISDEYILNEGMDRRIAKNWVNVGGEMVPYYAISQEQADAVLEAIQSADFTPRTEKERMVLQIISEEAESYYNGDKSIEEVTRIIQSRVSLLVQENE